MLKEMLLFQKVLDIYDSCQKDENGKLINRHSITDLEFSDPTDLERMGKLGVIAEIYPQIQSIANRKDKLAMIEEKDWYGSRTVLLEQT